MRMTPPGLTLLLIAANFLAAIILIIVINSIDGANAGPYVPPHEWIETVCVTPEPDWHWAGYSPCCSYGACSHLPAEYQLR